MQSARVPIIFVGISSDFLYPSNAIRSYAAKTQNAEYKEILTESGHDAVLAEQKQITSLLADVL